jgi:hypothetical protein
MPIVKITGQGLSAIALSVALLWGCWLAQRSVARRDFAERARVLRDLRQLRDRVPHAEPASAPPRRMHRPVRVNAG